MQLPGGQPRCWHVEWNKSGVRGQNGEMRGGAELLKVACSGRIDVEMLGSG